MRSTKIPGDHLDTRRVLPVLLGIVVAVFGVSHARAAVPETAAVDRTLEEAVLAENWKKVLALLDYVDTTTPSAILCLIKGHACLAENRNNESFCLFARTRSADDLKEWESWTRDLVARNSRNVAAHYLAGDAAARMGRWEVAVSSFGAALALKRDHVLTLNARAVAYAVSNDFDRARDGFVEATQLDPVLSDLYASRGAFIIQRRTDPGKVFDFYEKALKISPDSFVGLSGRASAEILLLRWEAAQADIDAGGRVLKGACADELYPLLAANVAVMAEMRSKLSADLLAQTAGMRPGMTLDEQMRELKLLDPWKQQLWFSTVDNNASFNAWVSRQWWIPKLDAGGALGLKGPVPFAELNAKLTWDLKQTSQYNLREQTRALELAGRELSNIRPVRIDNFTAFAAGHFDPDISRLRGGVSSWEIGAEPADTGDWQVPCVYGLAYAADRGDAARPAEVKKVSTPNGGAVPKERHEEQE